jgi:hypothetical protein
MFDRGMT